MLVSVQVEVSLHVFSSVKVFRVWESDTVSLVLHVSENVELSVSVSVCPLVSEKVSEPVKLSDDVGDAVSVISFVRVTNDGVKSSVGVNDMVKVSVRVDDRVSVKVSEFDRVVVGLLLSEFEGSLDGDGLLVREGLLVGLSVRDADAVAVLDLVGGTPASAPSGTSTTTSASDTNNPTSDVDG